MALARPPRSYVNELSPSTNPIRPTRMSTTPKICANRLSTMAHEPPRVLHECLVTKVYVLGHLVDAYLFLVFIRPSAWICPCPLPRVSLSWPAWTPASTCTRSWV